MRLAAALAAFLAVPTPWPATASAQPPLPEAPPRIVRTPLASQAQPPQADVATDRPFAPHIEALCADGIASGCATAPLGYCPGDAATRTQFAALHERGYPFPFPTETCSS